jgi:ammonia channel protein AmtB
MKRALTVIAVVLGLACLAAAYVYWTTPANALPSFFPGHDLTLTGIHTKHGLAALIVGFALLVFAWFNSGKKSSAAN